MSERKFSGIDEYFEYVISETGEFVREQGMGQEQYYFNIPQFEIMFTPCDECQDKLHKRISKLEGFQIGRGSIVLRKFLSFNDTYQVVVRCPATEEELADDDLPKFTQKQIEEARNELYFVEEK